MINEREQGRKGAGANEVYPGLNAVMGRALAPLPPSSPAPLLPRPR